MENTQKIKIVTADPSALGLFGLAIITLVASSQKLGITSGVSLVLPWARSNCSIICMYKWF